MKRLAGILFLMAALAARAGDWPVIHGDMDHTGVTSEQLTMPLSLSWTTEADHAPAPAFAKGMTGHRPTDAACQDYVYQTVIAGNRLYFGTSTDEAVTCLDTDTGEELWRVFLDGAIRMAPTLGGGRVYVGTDGGSVYCLDGATGNELWRFRAGPTNYLCVGHSRIMSSWPVRGGVLLNDGVAYFTAGMYPTAGSYLYAVNAATGEQIWRQQIQIIGNGSLKIVDGDKLWVSSGRVNPYEFRLSDGEPLMPEPDRRGARGGWWIGDVDGLPTWGPAENENILLRLSTNTVPGKWKNSSATQTNTLPNGIISGLKGYCAFAANNHFYLLGENNSVMAVSLANFRAARDARVQEILAMDKWAYGWVMAGDIDDDAGFTSKLTARAAWKKTVPVSGSGDLVWGIVAGTHLFLGGDNEVVALDSSTGNKVWSYTVDGEARGLAVADGALFVSTDTGKIYCFRNGASSPVTHTPSFSNPYANNPVYADAAATAITAAGRTKGYCVVLGAGEGELAYQIAQQSDFYVVCLDKDTNTVADARAKLAQAGIYGTRVSVHHEPNDVPRYANYIANLIVSDEAISTGALPYDPQGAFRMLQPYSGTVVLGSSAGSMDLSGWTHPQLSDWTQTNGTSGVIWQIAKRGKLPRAGEWTHAYGNPANTVSSHDRLVTTNLQVQWFGEPGMPDMIDRHKMSVAPLVKNGKMFRSGWFFLNAANDHATLTAIDVYNGTILWQTDLHSSGRKNAGHNTHPYACIGDAIFATSDNLCYQLDATSGELLHTFNGILSGCDWGYVGGLDHYLIGTSQSVGVDQEAYTVRSFVSTFSSISSRPASSRDLFVYDLTTNEKLWTYSGGAILNVSITVDQESGTLYFIESRNSTGMNDTTGQIEFTDFLAGGSARIVSMDLQTGAINWTKPITRNISNKQWIMYLTYADGVLLASRSYFTSSTYGANGYDFEALDASDGTTLWQTWKQSPGGAATWKNPLHSHPFYASGKFYFMARYYGTVYSFDPHTGAETADTAFGTDWEQNGAKSCSTPMASESAFYFRRNSHYLYDLETQKIQDITRVSRPGCWMSTIPAGGLVTMMEQSEGCRCGFPIRLSTVFAPQFENGTPPNVPPSSLSTNVATGLGAAIGQCYIAGISPVDPDAEFLISVLCPPSSERILQWQNSSGRVYTIWWTSNLLSSFQCLESNFTGGAFTDETHSAHGEGFYKIEVELE
jgi:outer membrane protein assembly factor BamB